MAVFKLIERDRMGSSYIAKKNISDQFTFYCLRMKDLGNGRSVWKVCCDMTKDQTAFMQIGIVKGTEEDARAYLEAVFKPEY